MRILRGPPLPDGSPGAVEPGRRYDVRVDALREAARASDVLRAPVVARPRGVGAGGARPPAGIARRERRGVLVDWRRGDEGGREFSDPLDAQGPAVRSRVRGG